MFSIKFSLSFHLFSSDCCRIICITKKVLMRIVMQIGERLHNNLIFWSTSSLPLHKQLPKHTEQHWHASHTHSSQFLMSQVSGVRISEVSMSDVASFCNTDCRRQESVLTRPLMSSSAHDFVVDLGNACTYPKAGLSFLSALPTSCQ